MRQNRINLFLFYWLPFIVWALVIFSFSSVTTPKVSQIHWEDFIVKKTAHVVEYAIFTTLLYRALAKSGVAKKWSLILAIFGAFLYGATDEFHQTYTPGREPRLRDTFIDTFGGLVAVYVITNVIPSIPIKYRKIFVKLEII